MPNGDNSKPPSLRLDFYLLVLENLYRTIMNSKQLLDEVLSILHLVKDDKEKLEKIYQFLMDEIYEEPEEIEIPENYKPLVSNIADSLSAGLVCFVNMDTLEVEAIHIDFLTEDPEEYEALTGETLDLADMKHLKWENCLTVDPLESHESFKIMEGFAEKMMDEKFQQKLIDALNRKRPFANFKWLIDNSDYRQDWFDYRQTWLEQYVYELLENTEPKPM